MIDIYTAILAYNLRTRIGHLLLLFVLVAAITTAPMTSPWGVTTFMLFVIWPL
jgi:hypothetical protein